MRRRHFNINIMFCGTWKEKDQLQNESVVVPRKEDVCCICI